MLKKFIFMIIPSALFLAAPIFGQDETDLAKKLANPVASLISIPIQVNYDENFGADGEGTVWRTNIQPVIPFHLNDKWNLISRTILPVVDQQDVPGRGIEKSGLGDTVQSLFLSPAAPTARGVIWGVGPVFLLPTASDEVLGTEKFGLGPTAVALRQAGPWTYGMLTNHIESIAGEDQRDDISLTLLQPFLTYITRTKTSLGLNTEATYNWESEQWSVPVNFTVQQLLKMGHLPLQVVVGARYWAESPENGAEDWGPEYK